MFEEGIVVGKFAPLTLGHIHLINIAATQCRHLNVILCFDAKFLAQQNKRDQKLLTLKNRLRWLIQTYIDIPYIDIVYIDETDLPPSPYGWQPYCDLVRQYVIPGVNTALFSSECEYDSFYRTYLPEVKHIIVDPKRIKVPISATMIRTNIYQNWDYLPSIVSHDYTIKVCIIGAEKSGKTTMAKYLAKLFNTSWVEEYSCTYCKRELANNRLLLKSQDYTTIVFRQKEYELQAIKSANKVTMIDCNAFMTEFYHRLHEGTSNSVVTAIAHEEQYDLMLILYPLVDHRTNNLETDKEYTESTTLFFNMLKEFPNQTPVNRTIHIIEDCYDTRLAKAVSAIENYMGLFNSGQI